MRKLDIISAVILIALAAYVIVTAGSFPQGAGTLGPGFFPTLIAGLLAAFAGWQLITALLKKKSEDAPSRPRKSLLEIFAVTGVYMVILPLVGFLISTPLFLIACGAVISEDIKQGWKAIVISGVATTGVLYTVFSVLLNVPLP
ncbi:hypothetical protein AXX12_05845 [Anaerosporomusa subterranea]|uniref:Major facilitator superfamily (MFS) profile domain-containing protein n=1 Tax=Anaerosporomusa subterranea TaxID=1794912 RepID=A0A154BPX6_ANASB|nr:tripartite tricarboxylate transporter TctB family protein [Anaerosporomusa subterranea]KYZ75961.1 hypothetical protein AXX12_05845 [Anaerosporomusa subterranea]MDF2500415.1 hypothetical protein [Anaerosporomusa subterranea]